MPHIYKACLDARKYIYDVMIMNRLKLLDAVCGILRGIQRFYKRLASAFIFAVLIFGFLLLNMPAVRQHNAAKLRSSSGSDDLAAETAFYQQR